ncbi:Protein of unknown function [Cotesia congregata]|uniref:Uncharacterized protein n=1 Tax=Cotesia congregata TaxID=51543 RepID=A0A8J2MCY8_COTCN|nr:Protein of unknown function [Cotesia congregata]
MDVCDQPAKSDCLNFVLYNADFGCTSCLIQDQTLCTDAGGHVHVYPYEPQTQLRTSVQTIQHANLTTPDQSVMGVKGNSALLLIMPDFIRRIAIDRMHCCDGGVIKKILTLLFDASYSDKVFSLRAVMNQIDNRLIGIKPPKFVHRMPRSINDLKHWKASELKMFCFYYAIPIFEGIMRPDYFQHLLKLIIGLFILSCDVISDAMIEVARDLLNCFVRNFEQLYGLRYCSINTHLLIHLPDSVRTLGPLWAHTCYESEDLNGQLLKLFHGTWHIDTNFAVLIYFVFYRNENEMLNDGLQGWNNEIVFPAVYMDNQFQRPIPLPGTITDIYDGELYREWFNNGFLFTPNNISFSWYTDGIPVYKSSHISIWPFYLTINELPFNERKKRENTLLLGYWFDDKKPYMNNFIYKFREELQRVAE